MKNIAHIQFAHEFDGSRPVDFKDNPPMKINADGNLPRGFFTVFAKIKGQLMIYVTKGDTIVGRIELNDSPMWNLRGSVMNIVGPAEGTVYHGNSLTGGEAVGSLTTFKEVFDGIVENSGGWKLYGNTMSAHS